MSKQEVPEGLIIAEKFFALLIIIIGALFLNATYGTYKELGAYSNVFISASIALIILGILMFIAKTE
ncbi:MAG: hypothetical protein K6T73_10955 [Candidatus Bathyarchaeota archaeon]|nr:hypothetical protein [Candidatus Bathyarchaeota archaeon]